MEFERFFDDQTRPFPGGFHNGVFVPVFAKPDASWQFENEEYIIEFKTTNTLHTYHKDFADTLSSWLRQVVACTQLHSYEHTKAFHETQSPIPENTKKYLLVILCWTEMNITILEVLSQNVTVCSDEWKGWFEAQQSGPLEESHYIRLLKDYFKGVFVLF